MKKHIISITLEMNELLEESQNVSLPYYLTRTESDGVITWYGLETNWSFRGGQWRVLNNTEWEECDIPKYETIYLQLK